MNAERARKKARTARISASVAAFAGITAGAAVMASSQTTPAAAPVASTTGIADTSSNTTGTAGATAVPGSSTSRLAPQPADPGFTSSFSLGGSGVAQTTTRGS